MNDFIHRHIPLIGRREPGRAHAARPVQRSPNGRARSAEPHLHRDPDQVRIILGADFCLSSEVVLATVL